jgi:hypothetical protein
MHCYNHADRNAVGTCKACHKGLCSECAVDLGFGLSCKGAHEQRVAEVEALISRNASIQRAAGRAKFAAPVFYLFMGLIFIGYGLLSSRDMKFILLLGIGFLAFGIYVLIANLRAFGNDAPIPNTSLERTREG